MEKLILRKKWKDNGRGKSCSIGRGRSNYDKDNFSQLKGSEVISNLVSTIRTDTIKCRKDHTRPILLKGRAIAQKVGEEAAEIVMKLLRVTRTARI